jgi:hypothetical protein
MTKFVLSNSQCVSASRRRGLLCITAFYVTINANPHSHGVCDDSVRSDQGAQRRVIPIAPPATPRLAATRQPPGRLRKSPALRRADAGGGLLPPAGDEERPLPHAWRPQHRPAHARGLGPIPPRPLEARILQHEDPRPARRRSADRAQPRRLGPRFPRFLRHCPAADGTILAWHGVHRTDCRFRWSVQRRGFPTWILIRSIVSAPITQD